MSDTAASGVAIDQVIVGHQFSLADFNAIGTSEEMFATDVGSKSDDWSPDKETSSGLAS